ncbi:MAG: hypothetical protein FWD49_06840 [Firmicutes bacterium]|nr:hypothetical protein [Bacillota bacterium]
MVTKLSDLMQKLRKIPAPLFVLLLLGSYLLANIYTAQVDFRDTFAVVFKEAFENSGISQDSVNLNTLFAIYFLFIGLFYVLLTELALKLIFSSFSSSRMLKRDSAPLFKTTARFFIILANAIAGLVSLLYFQYPMLEAYGTGAFYTAVFVLSLTLAYFVIAKTSVEPRYKGTMFTKLFALYFGIVGIFTGISLAVDAVGGTPLSVLMPTLIKFIVLIVLALAEYLLIAKKLLKEEKGAIPPPNFPPIHPFGSPDFPKEERDEIFKGFGF